MAVQLDPSDASVPQVGLVPRLHRRIPVGCRMLSPCQWCSKTDPVADGVFIIFHPVLLDATLSRSCASLNSKGDMLPSINGENTKVFVQH